jgi:hypothetical protein
VIARRELVAAALVAVVFVAAPTPGDVGGCGKTATALDPAAFARGRKTVDCQRCTDCGLHTQRCVRACDPSAPSDVQIPGTCHPILHDGEVCLDALLAASCSDYAAYVDDVDPATPSECTFCRLLEDGGTL